MKSSTWKCKTGTIKFSDGLGVCEHVLVHSVYLFLDIRFEGLIMIIAKVCSTYYTVCRYIVSRR